MPSEQLIPIEIVNPSIGHKIPEILHKFRQRPREFNLEEISKRLKDIRNYSIDNLDSLLQQLKETLERYPRVDTIYASDVNEAVAALKRICAPSKKIYVNNSSTVDELREHLIEQGFEIEETYYQEFEGFAPVKERKPYWQIPEVVPEVRWRSYSSIPVDWGGSETRSEGLKDKVVLFGVNAIAAEDGTVFFLEHSRNITRGLHEASRVVLLAGLEKIVQNREDALFQTCCIGLFGLEGISSELKLQSSMQKAPIENQQRDMNPQITLILLDNGRRAVRKNFKELLSCIGCRTCNAVCPVFSVYESRFEGPRNWLKIFNEVFENTHRAPGSEAVWFCKTCRLCQERCPFEMRHIDKFIRMREHLVEEGRISPTLRDALEATFLHGNPWGRARGKRGEWAKGLDIDRFDGHETLYYVGCMASYDPQCQEIARSLHRIFDIAGVSFGILGKEETCCGSEMRRIGERGLFEELAKQNTQTFKKTGAKKIVTISPHCFNTLKNEYGGDFDVLHYTQFLLGLLHKVEFKKELNCKVTYHDPCYLGRHNDIYDEPRKILRSLPGVEILEMEANRENSFCCGGGGGHMWIEWPHRPRTSEIRINQAIETGADTLAVACPFCLSTFDDAIKTLGFENKMTVKDLSQLIIEAMG